MSSYFDMVNKFNNESNDKAQHAADVGRVAIEQKAADLSELHSQLLEKYNTGSEALAGLGLAYGSARKVYKKIKTKGKDTDADPAQPDASTTDTNASVTDTSVADPSAAAAADPAAAIPVSSTSAAADSATAAADSAAAAAAPTAATADAGAAAVPAASEAQTILTQEGSDWDAIAAGDYSSLPGGGGAAAAPAAAAAPDVAPDVAPAAAPAPTPSAAPDPAAPLAETTAEEAGSGVLDFLGPAGLAASAVVGLVDLFKGIFDKVPTAQDITAKAPIVSGGGSIDASSLATAASTVGATQV